MDSRTAAESGDSLEAGSLIATEVEWEMKESDFVVRMRVFRSAYPCDPP
jgi:hypothetical protein